MIAGKSVTIAAAFDDDELETIHFTQVALGPKPAKGPHTIFIENEGKHFHRIPKFTRKPCPLSNIFNQFPPNGRLFAIADGKFAVGTLDREKCTQFSMDITIASDDVSISHTGESEVHVTGYRTIAIVGYEGDEEFEEDGMEDGLRRYRKVELESSDDEEDDEEEDEEDESSEDEEPPRAVPLQKNKNTQMIQDEASEGSEEEEEEDEDDDSSEEEDDEDSEEEEEEEEEAPPAKSAKRKQAAAQTPQPVKKAKAAEVAKGSTPNEDTPADDKEFASALKAFLQKNGPCKLSVLGSSVKRPPKSPKFKKLIEQNSDIFSFNAVTETVSLAK